MIYVDDLILCAPTTEAVQAAKAEIMSCFACKDMGEAKWILGLSVERSKDEGTLKLSQGPYIELLMKKHLGEPPKRRYRIPLPSNLKLAKLKSAESEQIRRQYREIIGGLLHVARCTRPDVSMATNFLARHLDTPGGEHLNYAKRILTYLYQSRDRKLTFRRSHKGSLEAFSNADWAGDCNDRKSTSGFVLKAFGGPFSWKSRKQDCVALSTMEAEYVALAECAREATWAQRTIAWITAAPCPTLLRCDNQAVLYSIKEGADSNRTKHIDIRHHYLRDLSDSDSMKFAYVTPS